jgi:SEC-C motif domain protein
MRKHKVAKGRPGFCPCGGAVPGVAALARAPRYADCCGRYIDADMPAPNAWELMRSRYTAYTLGATEYLRATWDPQTVPANLAIDPTAQVWLGLQILRYAELDETHALVEFVARFKVNGRTQRLQETSRFTRGEDGRWCYVDGVLSEV